MGMSVFDWDSAIMFGIEGSNVLLLGGAGMVGTAVGRALLEHAPARVVVAGRRKATARRAVKELRSAFPDIADRLVPIWGDVFIRAEWAHGSGKDRTELLAYPENRQRVIDDVIDPLDDEIVKASLLHQIITGADPRLDQCAADIVIDCMNTATAVSYQNIYTTAKRLSGLARADNLETDWSTEVEALLSGLSVPQLVRHVQILYAAMRAAGTRAYLKIGTSGTGGMGFNIPYTHGEEKPSRLLLSKAALAGAQTMLTFLMARTPDAPDIVREIKPTAMIGWRDIAYGPVQRGGQDIPIIDCARERAVSIENVDNLRREGDFGVRTGQTLTGVYIDTGENGLFSADEFEAITTPGQMQFITPEDIARSVIAELSGATTGRDVIGAIDGAVSGPTYRGGHLRQVAMSRLRDLERTHGPAIAFEIVGPPRFSKLLWEVHLLREAIGDVLTVGNLSPTDVSSALAKKIDDEDALRQRVISIGLGILLPDGKCLLRGPILKADTAHGGWVDLTPENIRTWQRRVESLSAELAAASGRKDSSRDDHLFRSGRAADAPLDPGEVVAWIFLREEQGRRMKD